MKLEELQLSVAEHLQRRDFLHAVPVAAQGAGDRARQLEARLNEDLGLAVTVLRPLPLAAADAATLSYDSVELRLRVNENPLLNEAGTNATTLAEALANTLHNWTPPVEGAPSPLRMRPETPWIITERDGRTTVELIFQTG